MSGRIETIHISNLDTGYIGKKGVNQVTKGINASLYSGELTCILGPNGAGKSTLLKTLFGYMPPLSGEITIESKPLKQYSDHDLAKVIGVVLTERLHINNMTVDELIAMGRSPYTGFWGRMNSYDRRIVDEAISLVNIEDLRGRMLQTLSDGERQKVMIAKSLAQETPIIFLDEPTAFLDYPSKVEIMRLLQRLSREKDKTIFLSTHDLELALQIADKIWLLDKPHGVTIGTPEDLSLNGDLAKYFQFDGATFDLASGTFKINHQLTKSVTLVGQSPYTNMLCKALARQGISTSQTSDTSALIRADETGYYLNNVRYDSVGMLLEAVNALTGAERTE